MKTATAPMIIGALGLFMKEIYRKLGARSQATLEEKRLPWNFLHTYRRTL